ncbi:MAG: ArsA-related P-loop ATPase [Actinomycetota bacterium]
MTGKGGTGKTTTAGALALALATEGKQVLVVEVEGRQGLAPLFDLPMLAYHERHIADVGNGGAVFGLAVEPQEALREYLRMFTPVGRAGGVLEKFGVIDFATTVAPGVRDVLLIGKVYEAVRRREAGRPVYNAVVLDAPPTGRIHRFLNVNADVSDLARVGPIRGQADSIMTLLRSPQTSIHMVTRLEDMPVQEAVDGITTLRSANLPVGSVVINRARDPILPVRRLTTAARQRLPAGEVAAGLAAVGLPHQPENVAQILGAVADHADHVLMQRDSRATLAEVNCPTYNIPDLPAVDLGAIYVIADLLRTQGMA